MSKSRFIPRVLHMSHCTPQEWRGRATPERIEQYIRDYISSQYPGGPNEHIARSLGHIDCPTHGKVVDQRTGETLAEWQMPAFYALP